MQEINDRRKHARSNDLAFAPRVAIRCPELSLKPLEVIDISMGGARIKLDDKRVWMNLLARKIKGIESVLPADLVIDGIIAASLKLQIHRFSHKELGVEFMFPTRYLQQLLKQTFFAELRAAAMKLEPPTEGSLRFYNNEMEYLEFRIEQGKVRSVEASLRSRAAVNPSSAVFFKFGDEGANPNVTAETARELRRMLKNLPYLTPVFAEAAIRLLEINLAERSIKPDRRIRNEAA